MECPFCTETIKDESLVCKNCTRDLTLVRPVIFEIQEMVVELDALQGELNRARMRLAMVETPARFLLAHVAVFIVLPSILLMAAHFLVTFGLDISPVYLRVASVLIPLPFGIALAISRNIGFRGAMAFGFAVAALSIPGMLAVTARLDNIDVLPSNPQEWREAAEYATSIALAFCTGNILATLLFQILPRSFSSRGKPNAVAYWIACLLGQHVGKEALRRRARLLQDILRTAGPLIGFVATASGSVYAGLKGFLVH
jgi:hypothetical protein